MRVVSDNDKCIGCLACVISCVDHHYDVDEPFPLPLRNYRRLTRPSGFTAYVTESCHHCKNALCIAACPTGALSVNEKGIVNTDLSVCIGCMNCAEACPFNIPKLRGNGKMAKCDMCAGNAECVTACPAGALSIQ